MLRRALCMIEVQSVTKRINAEITATQIRSAHSTAIDRSTKLTRRLPENLISDRIIIIIIIVMC